MKQRTALLACVLGSLLSVPAQAQFTITSTDLSAALTVGAGFKESEYRFPTSALPRFQVGAASEQPQTWTFAGLPNTPRTSVTTRQFTTAQPAGLPGTDFYDQATVAFTSSAFNSFVSLRSDGVVEEGWMVNPYQQEGYAAYRSDADGAHMFMLPMSLGREVTYRDSTYIIEARGALPGPIDGSVRSGVLRVDGVGTVTFPDGVTEHAFRLVRDQTITQYSQGAAVQQYRSLSVAFFAPSYRHLELYLAASETATSGRVRIDYARFVNPLGSTSTGIETPVAADFGMDAPFPNPARASVVVPYRLDASGRVSLAAYDALGRQVALLVQGVQPAGAAEARLDVSGWTPGVYVLRLVAGGATQTRLLTVL